MRVNRGNYLSEDEEDMDEEDLEKSNREEMKELTPPSSPIDEMLDE